MGEEWVVLQAGFRHGEDLENSQWKQYINKMPTKTCTTTATTETRNITSFLFAGYENWYFLLYNVFNLNETKYTTFLSFTNNLKVSYFAYKYYYTN